MIFNDEKLNKQINNLTEKFDKLERDREYTKKNFELMFEGLNDFLGFGYVLSGYNGIFYGADFTECKSSRFIKVNERIEKIEQKLDLLMNHMGLEFKTVPAESEKLVVNDIDMKNKKQCSHINSVMFPDGSGACWDCLKLL